MSPYHSKRKTGRVGSPIKIDHLAVVGGLEASGKWTHRYNLAPSRS